MRICNGLPGFGSLFTAGTALVAPMHELITREPLYRIPASRRRRQPPFRLISRLAGWLERWHQHQEQRRSLALLNDHLLRDVGLTRDDVDCVLHKPFWG